MVSCPRLRAGVRGAFESVVGRTLSGTTPFISCRNSCSSGDNFFCFLSTFFPFPRFGHRLKSVQYHVGLC